MFFLGVLALFLILSQARDLAEILFGAKSKVWTGNRRLRSANLTDPRASSARRLAFNVPSASNEKQDVQEAQMSCAGQINGMLSSFVAVSTFLLKLKAFFMVRGSGY